MDKMNNRRGLMLNPPACSSPDYFPAAPNDFSGVNGPHYVTAPQYMDGAQQFMPQHRAISEPVESLVSSINQSNKLIIELSRNNERFVRDALNKQSMKQDIMTKEIGNLKVGQNQVLAHLCQISEQLGLMNGAKMFKDKSQAGQVSSKDKSQALGTMHGTDSEVHRPSYTNKKPSFINPGWVGHNNSNNGSNIATEVSASFKRGVRSGISDEVNAIGNFHTTQSHSGQFQNNSNWQPNRSHYSNSYNNKNVGGEHYRGRYSNFRNYNCNNYYRNGRPSASNDAIRTTNDETNNSSDTNYYRYCNDAIRPTNDESKNSSDTAAAANNATSKTSQE